MTGDENDPTNIGEGNAPPPVPGEMIFASEPPFPSRSRRPAAYAAVVIGLFAMVGGAIFFIRNVESTQGSSSPTAAVQRFFDSASNEDVLGVLEALPSNERNLFTTRLQTLTKELGRLGILRSDVNLDDLQGIDLEFTDLRMRSEEVKEGLAAVEILNGRSTYSVNPASSPIGDFVRKLLPRSAFSAVRGSDDLADDEIVLATVKEGDDWFVSLFYTIAETARRETAPTLPVAQLGIAARGAPTPEAAVEELIRAAFGVELRRVVELMPPDEAAALHDYAGLFVNELEAVGAEASQYFRAQVKQLEAAARPKGDEYIVTVEKIALRIEIPEFDSIIEYDGKCATLSGEFFGFPEPERQCEEGFAGVAPLPLEKLPDLGFTVVERDGQFYVSPLRTMLDSLIEISSSLDREALDGIREFFGDFFGFGGDFMPSPFEPAPEA